MQESTAPRSTSLSPTSSKFFQGLRKEQALCCSGHPVGLCQDTFTIRRYFIGRTSTRAPSLMTSSRAVPEPQYHCPKASQSRTHRILCYSERHPWPRLGLQCDIVHSRLYSGLRWISVSPLQSFTEQSLTSYLSFRTLFGTLPRVTSGLRGSINTPYPITQTTQPTSTPTNMTPDSSLCIFVT